MISENVSFCWRYAVWLRNACVWRNQKKHVEVFHSPSCCFSWNHLAAWKDNAQLVNSHWCFCQKWLQLHSCIVSSPTFTHLKWPNCHFLRHVLVFLSRLVSIPGAIVAHDQQLHAFLGRHYWQQPTPCDAIFKLNVVVAHSWSPSHTGFCWFLFSFVREPWETVRNHILKLLDWGQICRICGGQTHSWEASQLEAEKIKQAPKNSWHLGNLAKSRNETIKTGVQFWDFWNQNEIKNMKYIATTKDVSHPENSNKMKVKIKPDGCVPLLHILGMAAWFGTNCRSQNAAEVKSPPWLQRFRMRPCMAMLHDVMLLIAGSMCLTIELAHPWSSMISNASFWRVRCLRTDSFLEPTQYISSLFGCL